MQDVMIDFETFGTGFNSVVVQVGACFFDRKTGEIGKTFIHNIAVDSSVDQGFEMDGDTIYWWLQQDIVAIESILAHPRLSVDVVFHALNDFIEGSEAVWSHATFDFVIMMNHFKRLNIVPLVSFRTARDIRTLVDIANIDVGSYKGTGTKHNALDDCKFQVKYVVDGLNNLSCL
jgi:hypothetical protein